MLRSQRLDANQLNTVFRALIISLISYALPACLVFLSAGQCEKQYYALPACLVFLSACLVFLSAGQCEKQYFSQACS